MNLITPPKKHFKFGLKEILSFRDVLYFLVLRDVKILYKQTILGFAWAILQPLLSMLLFAVVFGFIARIETEVPYPLFAYCALIPWTYFSQALQSSINSMIGSGNLMSKVYFPRLIIPLTPVFAKFIDFAIAFTMLIPLMLHYQYCPGKSMLFLPVFILLLLITTLGISIWLSAAAILYRDVRFASTFLVQVLLYAAPVVWPTNLIEAKFGTIGVFIYGFYPMSGVIEGFRATILNQPINWNMTFASGCSAIIIFLTGLLFFKSREHSFTDVA